MDLKQLPGIGDTHTQQEEEEHFHVLAVDDSLIDRKLLERLLTISSYQVTCVDSGDKALEYLGLLDDNIIDSTRSSSPPSPSCSGASSSSQSPLQEVHGSKVNLIITDYSMPGMNGYDLLRRVKGSSWKDVPVVVMSSENVPSRINMCLEGGAEEFLLKPVQLSDLRKLQPHLLKPLGHSSCQNPNTNLVENHNVSNDEEEENNSNTIHEKNSCKINKRKKISPECTERRPKLKELVVV